MKTFTSVNNHQISRMPIEIRSAMNFRRPKVISSAIHERINPQLQRAANSLLDTLNVSKVYKSSGAHYRLYNVSRNPSPNQYNKDGSLD